jgi:hypothetical protein
LAEEVARAVVDRLTHFTGATIMHKVDKWSTSEFLSKARLASRPTASGFRRKGHALA